MTEKPSLTKLLKANAGLSDQGALIYKYILIVGSLTIGEVCEYTGLSYELVSKALDELVEKKLIRRLTQVTNRYVAVAPYRAFAEVLVEFQRAMKELEESARRTVETALTEISKTNETWKASAIRLREEQVSQARQDIRVLREEASTARRTLIDKLKQETDAKSSSLIGMLKRHLEEHTAKVSTVEKDITLKVDNAITKFTQVAIKLKEQASQTATSYLSEFDEKISLFLGGVETNLVSFQSDFSSYVEGFQGQTSTFLDDTSVRIVELTDSVKAKTLELIKIVDGSFSQISNQLQGTVSKNTESAAEAVSASSKDLEMNLDTASRTHAEELSEAITSYQAKTREEIDRWYSATKEEIGTRFNSLKEEIESTSEYMINKIELTKDPISETMKSHLSSTETSSNDLGLNLVSLTESLKRDLVSKTGSPIRELQESCEVTAKECSLLGSTLEDLSKRNIPLASKTITDFTSDVNAKLSKMTTNLVTNAKSFVSQIKERALEVIDDLASAQPRSASVESEKKSNESQIKPSALRKDLSKQIDAATGSYVDEIEKSIEAVDKQASARISAVSGFEKELGKKWDSIKDALGEVTELTAQIKSFPQRAGSIVNDLVEQYGKRADSTIASTKRILNVHSTTLADAMSGTMKKWSTAVSKARTELVDLSRKRVETLEGLSLSQISQMERITVDRLKALADLVSQKIDAIKSEDLASQASVSKHVGSNIQIIGGLLKDLEGKLKNALLNSHNAFNNEMDLRTKENNELSAQLINRAKEMISDLKGELITLIDQGKEHAKQVCESTNSQLRETTSQQTKELHEIIIAATESFGAIIASATEGFRQEGQSIKEAVGATLSQHVRDYSEIVNDAINEIGRTFAEHFQDCDRLTEDFGRKLDELLATHQDGFEKTAAALTEGLTNCINQDESAIDDTSRKMLQGFTNDTTKTAKEAGSVENLMRTAWTEITDTQQISADKTWHYVTKQAVLHHMKDMVKRTKSTVTVVVPDLQEAPIKEVKEISKSIRINIIAGIDEARDKKLLRELFTQGNVRLWSLTEKDYISCTRDAEEVLIAPVTRKDTDCVATVSIEENYVKLYHKFIGPMWMASSREIKEKALG